MGRLDRGDGRFESIETRQDRQRQFLRASAIDRRREQMPSQLDFAAIERRDATVQHLFRFTLLLGECRSCTLDVRASAGMTAVQKEHPRPDVDRLLVVADKIVIETRQQQVFGLCVVLRPRALERTKWLGSPGVGHETMWQETNGDSSPIMEQRSPSVNFVKKGSESFFR